MRNLSQLDADGYFIGVVTTDESPLEEDVELIPAGAIDAKPPKARKGYRAKWSDGWIFEPDLRAVKTSDLPKLKKDEKATRKTEPELIGDEWVLGWSIVTLSDSEKAAASAQRVDVIKQEFEDGGNVTGALLKVMFIQENRIRRLAGEPEITRAQFNTWASGLVE